MRKGLVCVSLVALRIANENLQSPSYYISKDSAKRSSGAYAQWHKNSEVASDYCSLFWRGPVLIHNLSMSFI